MSTLITILALFTSVRIASLPIVEHELYLSNSGIRADRVLTQASAAKAPEKINAQSLGPRISATSAIVVDANSGAVLYEKHANQSWPMASIVKLVSALVFLEADPVLDQRIEMLEEDDRAGGDDFIRPGEAATLADYLEASLLASANNATIVLARSTGLTEAAFVERMNQKVQSLGMHDTRFTEPSGLSPKNVSTAQDTAKLLGEVSKHELITEITGTHQGFIRVYPAAINRRALTTNHLMGSIVFVEFGKTGYLDESLYNLAAAVSTREGNTLYIVTLGSESNEDRVQDAKNLTIWSEQTYQW
jgi:serine-type D-Ala-D-Ala endopeptidase (penicillin-binding protein 7)